MFAPRYYMTFCMLFFYNIQAVDPFIANLYRPCRHVDSESHQRCMLQLATAGWTCVAGATYYLGQHQLPRQRFFLEPVSMSIGLLLVRYGFMTVIGIAALLGVKKAWYSFIHSECTARLKREREERSKQFAALKIHLEKIDTALQGQDKRAERDQKNSAVYARTLQNLVETTGIWRQECNARESDHKSSEARIGAIEKSFAELQTTTIAQLSNEWKLLCDDMSRHNKKNEDREKNVAQLHIIAGSLQKQIDDLRQRPAHLSVATEPSPRLAPGSALAHIFERLSPRRKRRESLSGPHSAPVQHMSPRSVSSSQASQNSAERSPFARSPLGPVALPGIRSESRSASRQEEVSAPPPSPIDGDLAARPFSTLTIDIGSLMEQQNLVPSPVPEELSSAGQPQPALSSRAQHQDHAQPWSFPRQLDPAHGASQSSHRAEDDLEK